MRSRPARLRFSRARSERARDVVRVPRRRVARHRARRHGARAPCQRHSAHSRDRRGNRFRSVWEDRSAVRSNERAPHARGRARVAQLSALHGTLDSRLALESGRLVQRCGGTARLLDEFCAIARARPSSDSFGYLLAAPRLDARSRRRRRLLAHRRRRSGDVLEERPYLRSAYTREPDATHPQWALVDFGARVPVDAARIAWADPYATPLRRAILVGRRCDPRSGERHVARFSARQRNGAAAAVP